MEKYEDRIGEFAVGISESGKERSGYYVGTYEGYYKVSSNKEGIGEPEVYGHYCTSIRFLSDEQNMVHPIFEHAGKRALVWNSNKSLAKERTLICTKSNGNCFVVDCGFTIDDYYDNRVGSSPWVNYELIPEKTIDLKCTYQGKEISHEEALELLKGCEK